MAIKQHVVADGDLPEPGKPVLGCWDKPEWSEAERWGIVRCYKEDGEETTGWEVWSYPMFDMCTEPAYWFELPTVVIGKETN